MPTWHMLSFQDSSSPSMEQLVMLHDFFMAIFTMVMVTLTVNMLSVLTYVLTDRILVQDHTIELIWTISPVFIILLIVLPSLQTLYIADDPFSPNITIKATGHQWYWSYEYSDFPGMEFDSYMTVTPDLTLKARLLETDNCLALPVHSQVRLLATGADVIHSWTVPSFGVKADAVPGRLNQLMFSIKRPGIFYGQCSEICGPNHSFMPIKVEALPMKNFLEWVTSFK
nr:TPA_asm: COX2 [Baikalogammarus pullus]